MICELTNKMDAAVLKMLWMDLNKEYYNPPTEASISDFITALIVLFATLIFIAWWYTPGALLVYFIKNMNSPFGFLHKKRFKCGKQ